VLGYYEERRSSVKRGALYVPPEAASVSLAE